MGSRTDPRPYRLTAPPWNQSPTSGQRYLLVVLAFPFHHPPKQIAPHFVCMNVKFVDTLRVLGVDQSLRKLLFYPHGMLNTTIGDGISGLFRRIGGHGPGVWVCTLKVWLIHILRSDRGTTRIGRSIPEFENNKK